MKTLPTPIQDDHTSLTPGAMMTLYEIKIPDEGTIYISPQQEVMWLGNTYDFLAATMADLSYESNGKLNRPKFSVVNPAGMFSADVAAGRLDRAEVTRIRIMKADLDANLDFAIRETLNVGRVMSLTNQLLVLELKDVMDGNMFQLPARRYMPPEFPHVRLD